MVDVALSLAILSFGVFIILSSFTSTPAISQTEITSEDVTTFLAVTTIEDLNHPIVGLGGSMMKQGLITRHENSLLQQIGEFATKGNFSLAEQFIDESLKDTLPRQFLLQIDMDSQRIYPRNFTQKELFSRGNTSLLVSKNTVAYGLLDEGNSLWGPSTFTITVWQR